MVELCVRAKNSIEKIKPSTREMASLAWLEVANLRKCYGMPQIKSLAVVASVETSR